MRKRTSDCFFLARQNIDPRRTTESPNVVVRSKFLELVHF